MKPRRLSKDVRITARSENSCAIWAVTSSAAARAAPRAAAPRALVNASIVSISKKPTMHEPHGAATFSCARVESLCAVISHQQDAWSFRLRRGGWAAGQTQTEPNTFSVSAAYLALVQSPRLRIEAICPREQTLMCVYAVGSAPFRERALGTNASSQPRRRVTDC